MTETHRNARLFAGIALAFTIPFAGGCGGSETKENPAEIEAKAREAAAAELKQPVGLISAYLPYLSPGDTKDPYLPKRRADEDKAAACAANEVRHAANGGRQKLRGDSNVTKELTAVLGAAAGDCANVEELTAAAKCAAAVAKIDEAIKKVNDGPGTAKVPRVGPDAITDEAKKSLDRFLRAKGPGDAMKAYIAKRSDASAQVNDVIAACQAAADEATAAADAFEKADEPIRLIAVTRKMSMDSQCNTLNTTDTLRKDLDACRKNAKTTDCKIVCGKAKARVEEGLPAAAFTPLEKDVADICKE